MELKAKHKKNFYKNEDAWLDAVYRNNKDVIDKTLEDAGITGKRQWKNTFKNFYQEYREEGLSPTQAMKRLSNSNLFTPEWERGAKNFENKLRELRIDDNTSGWKAVRQKLKNWKSGKFEKIESTEYSKELGGYIYNGYLAVYFQKVQGKSIGVLHIWNMETNQHWELAPKDYFGIN